MPHYYIKYLKFTKVLVAEFVKEFCCSGAISVFSLSRVNRYILCGLTGNKCSVMCPKFNTCNSKNYIIEAYTLGVMYCLLMLKRTVDFEQREFEFIIHTGKRLVDSISTEWEPYSLLNEVDTLHDESIDDLLSRKVEVDSKFFGKDAQKIIDIFRNKSKQSLENINKLIDSFKKTKGKVPSHLLNIKSALSSRVVSSLYDISFSDHMALLVEYIKNKIDISYNVILNYLVFDYVPTDKDDFPYSELDSNLNKIYQNMRITSKFDEGNPFRWDEHRLELYKQEKDPYKKLVIFDDRLYLWKKYILSEDIELTEEIIRGKYILDYIIKIYAKEFTTKYIIYEHVPDLVLSRYKNVVSRMLKLLYMQGVNLFDLFTEEQVKYQAMFREGVSTGEYLPILYGAENKTVTSDPERLFNSLKSANLITFVRIISWQRGK